MKQTFEADFMGLKIQSLELIGYDPASDIFPLLVYSNLAGIPVLYRYDIQDKSVIITKDLTGEAI